MSEVDADALMREEIRRMRGAILRTLRACYGELGSGATYQTLRRSVLRSGMSVTERSLKEALVYLADRAVGLIERKEAKLDQLDTQPVVTYHLAAKGLQVLEGVASDPGVEL